MARPVGPVERGLKWVRRQPVVAGLAATVALVLLAGSLVAWGLAAWALGEKGRADEQARLATANAAETREEKGRADASAKQAQAKEKEARGAKQLADVSAAEAREQKKVADHQLGVAELRLYAGQLAQRSANGRMARATRCWRSWTAASGTSATWSSVFCGLFTTAS